ncbi:penicillin-binding protein 1A [Chryseolinea lacunae]|uniref:Transglycosylase domain-containing protein n=1 Tax=Chryseolinea lacunae TaxID=2801331 RepID=A0ABS1L0B4_9BACT|nr:transglycosylase domain-containing protein [Chryseolinea lacunae]MBL0745134.1 transglycosylase domain-containing protein [Chryseolinea lacunae]
MALTIFRPRLDDVSGFMEEQFKRLTRSIQYFYIQFLRKIRPLRHFLRTQYDRIREYYRTHPKARRWTLILGPPVGLFLLLMLVVWIEVPSKRELRNIQNQVASEVYSADSVLLGRYYIQDRTEVKYEDISPMVMDALIATEDVRFYEHEGVDYISLGRVLVKSILQQDESSGGGSTITQQLSKNLYPRRRYWVLSMLINKMREAITARRLESIYSKKELITLYLNTIPFADNTFGIQAAAQRFYSSTAKDLTLDQAAVLVGMLKATTYYNPRTYPDRAFNRRNVVLRQMVKYNFVTESKADSLQVVPIELKYNKISHHQGLAPYFREFLKAELLNWCKNNTHEDGSTYNLYTDGLKIYTTIDSRLQDYAEKAVTQQMTDVQKQFFDHWGKDKPWKGREEVLTEAIHRSSRYRQLKQRDLSEKEIMAILKKPIPMRMFTWKGEEDAEVSPIDSIIHHLQYLNAGFLAMEPGTGKVKAWVGGIEHDFFQYDHVKTSTKRQVGSTFKPIVYAMAIEKGVPPCELISAGQQTYIDKEGEKWTPRNSQNDYQVEYTMRGALAYSVNTVAVKLIQLAGVDNTIALARKMGISSEMPDVPSIALGSSSISLMEMTGAYACIANEGVANFPYYVENIRDLEGKVYTDFKPEGTGKRALSKETAQLVTRMMQTVVHEGTASRLRWRYGIYNDVAGKTGTTQANADGWFMAMTPNLVMGTWVGADDPRIRFRLTELGQGSNTALPMVGYFLKHVNQDEKFKPLSEAKFKNLPNTLQQELNCDLYELSDTLIAQIKVKVMKRDSIMLADTSKAPPNETFLETLYKRKLKMMRASQPDTANVSAIKVLGG